MYYLQLNKSKEVKSGQRYSGMNILPHSSAYRHLPSP